MQIRAQDRAFYTAQTHYFENIDVLKQHAETVNEYLAVIANRLSDRPRVLELGAGIGTASFLRKQYEYYFRATGFDPTFYGVAPGK